MRFGVAVLDSLMEAGDGRGRLAAQRQSGLGLAGDPCAKPECIGASAADIPYLPELTFRETPENKGMFRQGADAAYGQPANAPVSWIGWNGVR